MAKTVFWVKNSTDFSLDTSWKTSTAGATTVPVSTDTIRWAEGSDEVQTGLTQSAVDTAEFWIKPGCSPRIGANGTPLEISCTGAFIYEADEGFVFLKAGSANIASLRCFSPRGQLYLVGGVIDGRIDVGSFLRITGDQSLSGNTLAVYKGAEVLVQYKADGTDPVFTQNGGFCRLERPTLTASITGGECVMAVEREAVACPAVTVKGDAKLTVLRGTITNLDAKEATGTIVLDGLVTITDSQFGPDVTVIRHKATVFTNTPTLYGNRSDAAGGPTWQFNGG